MITTQPTVRPWPMAAAIVSSFMPFCNETRTVCAARRGATAASADSVWKDLTHSSTMAGGTERPASASSLRAGSAMAASSNCPASRKPRSLIAATCSAQPSISSGARPARPRR